MQDFGGDTGSIYDNDLAIIKLNSPLVFGNEISPACLPESSFAAEEQGTIVKAVVSGWGKSKSGKYCVQFENFMDNFLDNVGETFGNAFADSFTDTFGDILWHTFRDTFVDTLWGHFCEHFLQDNSTDNLLDN